jgi:protein-tyrosine phosphatase
VLSEQRRHLPLAGTRNLRDVGGYPTRNGRQTRWHMLYRSDCLAQLTASSQAELLGLGVRTVIDLRTDVEVATWPNVFARSRRVRYRRVPMREVAGQRLPALEEGYLHDLDTRGDCFVAVCQALLAPAALPAVIHCAAGKDRTGVSIALLLAVAGVEDEVIADDYALTDTCVGDFYVEEGRQWLSRNGYTWEQYGHLIACPPERMQYTLEHIGRRWGNPEGYLMAHGLAAESRPRLRDLLTEPLS